MKKILLSMAAAAMTASAFAAAGDSTTILNQTFATGTELTESSDYTWGSDIASMITNNGLYVTNNNGNYENRDFVTFTNVIGNETHEVNVTYELYSVRDKGQANTNYAINYFNVDGEFIFGIQEWSGGWAYGADIITANADGTTTQNALPAGHMKKGGGSVVNLDVKFNEDGAVISIDGGSYTAYSNSEGIKDIKLSVTGGGGYDRDMNIKNFKVSVTEVVAAVFAEYKVNYVCDGEIIKTETKTGEVGTAVSLTSSDTANFTLDGVKYIYVSNDAEGKTVAEDGSTVVTVNFRKAASYTYTVKNNVNDAVVTGTCVEGESVSVPYSRYILKEGVVYLKNATNKEYNYTFTPNADDFTVTLEYAETGMTNGIFFSEAEDLEGMTLTTAQNASVRCSNAAGGWADEEVTAYTLAAGKYIVTIGGWGNDGATLKVAAGETEVLTAETNGSWLEKDSGEFTLTQTTPIILSGSNSSKPFDFILITGTKDEGLAVEAAEVAEGEGKWYNLQGVQVAEPREAGIYIHNGKKVIVK